MNTTPSWAIRQPGPQKWRRSWRGVRSARGQLPNLGLQRADVGVEQLSNVAARRPLMIADDRPLTLHPGGGLAFPRLGMAAVLDHPAACRDKSPNC